MTGQRKFKRREERKYKRIQVRYGVTEARHTAAAQQISPSGMFLVTNDAVYAHGSPLVVEIQGPAETWLVAAIVRHALKVHPTMARFTRPGMGVELMNAPPACRAYLAAL
jgi:hypothetical protein